MYYGNPIVLHTGSIRQILKHIIIDTNETNSTNKDSEQGWKEDGKYADDFRYGKCGNISQCSCYACACCFA